MSDCRYRLNDDEVISFIIRGYHLVEADFRPASTRRWCGTGQVDGEPRRRDPGPGAELHQVYDHPKVRGALASLLGEDVRMSGHRHCHVNRPGTRSQSWHQDGTEPAAPSSPHACWRYVLPAGRRAGHGPTVLMPGTHFRNASRPHGHLRATSASRWSSPSRPAPWPSPTTTSGTPPAPTAPTARRYMSKFLFNRAASPPAARAGTTIREQRRRCCAALFRAAALAVRPLQGAGTATGDVASHGRGSKITPAHGPSRRKPNDHRSGIATIHRMWAGSRLHPIERNNRSPPAADLDRRQPFASRPRKAEKAALPGQPGCRLPGPGAVGDPPAPFFEEVAQRVLCAEDVRFFQSGDIVAPIRSPIRRSASPARRYPGTVSPTSTPRPDG